MKRLALLAALVLFTSTGLAQHTVTSTSATCTPTANSSGQPGQLNGFGTYPALTLTYQNLPQLQYGQVIFAPATCVGSSTPIGSGVLCVCHDPSIGGICRGPVFNTASGSGSVPIDLLNPANATQPCQSFPGIFIGTTWNFQIYHRDVVAPGVNLTNGIEVVVG